MKEFGPLTRRALVAGAVGGILLARGVARAEDPQPGESGLIREDWFLNSALDLAADHRLAGERGKHLVLLWEIKDSPLCAETHIKTLGDATIAAYIHTRFEIVQFDAAGARDVIDFDGSKVPEKALAAKYGVRMMPALLFFPQPAETLAGKPPAQREVARLQGYVAPRHVLAVCRFVAEKAYLTTTLRDYLRALQI